MSSTAELAEAWSILDLAELQAIHHIATSPQLQKTSIRMAQYLGSSLNAEADYREHFKSKLDQVPPVDAWADGELSDAYLAAIMIERASAGGTGRLMQWAELLRMMICSAMAARLTARQIIEDAPCDK